METVGTLFSGNRLQNGGVHYTQVNMVFLSHNSNNVIVTKSKKRNTGKREKYIFSLLAEF